MAIKTTGAEWKKFYSDMAAWPTGAWHDDEEITIDGKSHDSNNDLALVTDTAAMVVSGGVVFLNEGDEDGPTLESHFKKWRKAQNTVFGVVEVSKELADVVRAAILAAGGKISGL